MPTVEIKSAILPGWHVLLVNGTEVYRDNAKWKVQNYIKENQKVFIGLQLDISKLLKEAV